MRKFLSIDSIANDIMMSRSYKRNHSALLVEGPDDLRVYGNFLHPNCLPFALDGRDQVLGAINLLAARGQRGVAGIIDADCDYLNGIGTSPNIFRTDDRDLEATLFNSTAFERVIQENLPVATNIPADLRKSIVRCCKDLGYLRCASLRNRWHLDFKTIEYGRFVDATSLTSDRQKLCAEVLRKNLGFGRTGDDLVALLRGEVDQRHNDWHVVSGHDLSAVLALWIGAQRSMTFYSKVVESQLRLAFEGRFFTTTMLHKQIRIWEEGNVPFRLLKEQI